MKIEQSINTTVYRIGDGSYVTVKYDTVTAYDALTDLTFTKHYRPDVAQDMALAIAQLLERGYKLIGGLK